MDSKAKKRKTLKRKAVDQPETSKTAKNAKKTKSDDKSEKTVKKGLKGDAKTKKKSSESPKVETKKEPKQKQKSVKIISTDAAVGKPKQSLKSKKVVKEGSIKSKTVVKEGSTNSIKEKVVLKGRRPWRNQIRKKAAKEAAKKLREEREAQLAKVKGSTVEEITEKGEKKKKKKKKKKKTPKSESENVEQSSENVEERLKIAKNRMNSARFRYLNEKLYTSSGQEALEMFTEDPQAFQAYHEGYRSQTRKWPFNPVNGIIQWLRTVMASKDSLEVADLGCGDAKIAQVLSESITVHSFDLVAVNPNVTACNMAKLPLENEKVDVAVFCLSLMGVNLNDYLREANRILKKEGLLKIAEVCSRFTSLKQFIYGVEKMGFDFIDKRTTGDNYFVMLEFKKSGKVQQKRPIGLKLQPCLYKKR